MIASCERERVRVTLGTSGIGTTARLETVCPEAVCSVTPLVEGRLRKGRAGLLDKEADRSLSSLLLLKVTGYLSEVAIQRDRFKVQLIGPRECKPIPISKPNLPSYGSLTPSVGREWKF